MAPAEALRLFTTLGDGGRGASSDLCNKKQETAAASAALEARQRLERLASGSSRWSPFYALSSRHDMPTTSLLLRCISLGHCSSEKPAGFDRESGGSSARQLNGQLATAFAEQLVPGWWYLTHTPGWRWHLQNVLESPCFGVPGLCCYTAARSNWLAQQIQAGIDVDSCRQVVVLQSGWSTWAHSMAQRGVQFYEIDSRQAVQAKKELLDGLLPGWRRAAQRPRFVEVDFTGSLKTLITELTAAGFDPSLRCCVVAEGLLAYLPQEQADSLIRDLSALCAPGSRFLFDCLHTDALEGKGGDLLPGFAALAQAAANKGSPLKGCMKPAFSAMVKYFQPHRFRVAQVLQPHEVAAFWKQQQQQQMQQAAVTGGKHGTAAGPSTAKPQSSLTPGSSNPAPAPVACGMLPYVPEYFSLVVVTKIDSRLLLRRAASGPGPAPGEDSAVLGGSASGWLAAGSAAALNSPSCIVRSLAFLLWGGTRLQALPSSAGAAAAATATAAPELALLPPAPLHHQRSGEWSLAAVASQPPASRSSAPSPAATPASSSTELVHFTRHPCPVAAHVPEEPTSNEQLETPDLKHALSIGPIQQQRQVPGGAVRSSSRRDAGHVLAQVSGSTGSGGGSGQGEATEEEMAWGQSSIFSFSLFF